MRHCCEFDAFDIWYLNENEKYSDRVLFIGDCPICGKHVCILRQLEKSTNNLLTVKKIGESAKAFSKQCYKEISYTRNNINKMMLKPKPYSWKYGVNKEKKDKDGNITIEQYAMDFYGNSELIKKEKLPKKFL